MPNLDEMNLLGSSFFDLILQIACSRMVKGFIHPNTFETVGANYHAFNLIYFANRLLVAFVMNVFLYLGLLIFFNNNVTKLVHYAQAIKKKTECNNDNFCLKKILLIAPIEESLLIFHMFMALFVLMQFAGSVTGFFFCDEDHPMWVTHLKTYYRRNPTNNVRNIDNFMVICDHYFFKYYVYFLQISFHIIVNIVMATYVCMHPPSVLKFYIFFITASMQFLIDFSVKKMKKHVIFKSRRVQFLHEKAGSIFEDNSWVSYAFFTYAFIVLDDSELGYVRWFMKCIGTSEYEQLCFYIFVIMAVYFTCAAQCWWRVYHWEEENESINVHDHRNHDPSLRPCSPTWPVAPYLHPSARGFGQWHAVDTQRRHDACGHRPRRPRSAGEPHRRPAGHGQGHGLWGLRGADGAERLRADRQDLEPHGRALGPPAHQGLQPRPGAERERLLVRDAEAGRARQGAQQRGPGHAH
eukprot:600002-Hanusia_phi.AAC.1